MNALVASIFGNLDAVLESARTPASTLLADIAATLVELTVEITSYVGKRVGEGIDKWEAEAGPEILRAAAAGLSDYFGVAVSPSQLSPSAGPGQRFNFARQLGQTVLENMFGAFTPSAGLTPEVGLENAEKVLGFNIATALESWLGQITSEAPLINLIPNWADLDDVMSANLGLGRANRRVLGPLLKTLIVDPLTWDLNRRFVPERLTPAELLRLERGGQLDPGTFAEQMSWYGYSQANASRYALAHETLPAKEDLSRALELRLVTEDQAGAVFRKQGFSDTAAELMVTLAREERVRSINTALETLARDMYRDREIDEPELRSILAAAGRAPGEIESLAALATLERSRPRPLPRGDIEEGYRRGLIPLSRLREYYAQFGFSLEDQVLLEELAVLDRTESEKREEREMTKAGGTEFRTVPAAQMERAYIEGRIGSGRLREFYDERGYSEGDVSLLMENAAARKTEFDRRIALELARAKSPERARLARGTVEEAFYRDVISAGELSAYYLETGLSGADADIALRTARDKKAERQERLEEELRRANRSDFLELPRAVMEEAFFRGIVDLPRLSSWYQGRGFRPEELPILLELAEERKLERLTRPAPAPPKAKT